MVSDDSFEEKLHNIISTSCSRKDDNTNEKQGENVDLLLGGAPSGATWGEIRKLITACDELPADVRGRLVAFKDEALGATSIV